MWYRRFLAVTLLGLLTGALACAPGEQREVAEETQEQVVPADTTAGGLWAHLQSANYRERWSMWPGKTALYTGTEPHGMLLTTYVNELALDALTNKAGAMPGGAIVVKENYMPDSVLAAVTVMYKAAGYNAEHRDWFFLKRLADGTVEASGRVQGCQDCHGTRAENDYIFTSSLSGQ